MNRQRVFAIVERELRKFVRTPMILFMTLLMPLMQLFVLGNAFGGRTTHLQIAVVKRRSLVSVLLPTSGRDTPITLEKKPLCAFCTHGRRCARKGQPGPGARGPR